MSEDKSLQEDQELIEDSPAEPTAAETTAAAVEELDELLDEPAPFEQLAEQLKLANDQSDKFRDQFLRTQAEMENLRRRTEKEVQDARKFALERFAKDLLVVLDSLELGIQAAVGEAAEVVKHREGSELTLKQFLSVLDKYNVKPVPALGEKFDPNLHQAVTMEPNNAVEPNTITKVFQTGYTLNERLLRPAMVVIAQKA